MQYAQSLHARFFGMELTGVNIVLMHGGGNAYAVIGIGGNNLFVFGANKIRVHKIKIAVFGNSFKQRGGIFCIAYVVLAHVGDF